MSTSIQRSSGDIFTDLRFEAEETFKLRNRSDLMIELSKPIKERGLTQIEAARLFRATQPRVGDLTRGKIDRSSVDSLLGMLGHAGANISLVVTVGDRQIAQRSGAVWRDLSILNLRSSSTLEHRRGYVANIGIALRLEPKNENFNKGEAQSPQRPSRSRVSAAWS